ncbi:MAG TPA: MBL fold metallo-hydrolase, partial [Thermomicrobiaceae bacterium]|nr:MBL fold metallo-hydrolase [Thermomicrobiaceae bacterium]
MPLAVRTIVAGPIQTNAYLVIDETTSRSLIVDAPPDSADALLVAANEAGATIDLIVLTHHHWDHIADATRLAKTAGAPVAAHPAAVAYLERPRQ